MREENYEQCVECKYYTEGSEDFYCNNPESEYYSDYTFEDDHCGYFEQRGVE